jgi:aarF domain-containing kinase
LRQFRANFYRNDQEEERSEIIFPRPVEGWVSEKVLVETYVHSAVPISHYLSDSTPQGRQVRKELAGPLLRAFLKMVFVDNLVHGDLHPGNVQVMTINRNGSNDDGSTKHAGNNNNTVQRKIVFLDAGIATSLAPADQQNLHDLFRAVVLNDGRTAGRLMVERAQFERCSQIEGGVDSFASGIADIVSEFHDRRKEGLTLGAVRVGSLLGQVLDLCRLYGVEIDPAMANIVISTLVLEGLGRSLEPSLNLFEFAIPFVLGRGRV